MITIADLRATDPRDIADDLAFTVSALVTASRLTLENDGSGVSDVLRIAAASTVLELAEQLLGVLGDGASELQRETGRGLWAKPTAPAEVVPGTAEREG